jgi:hypothetical protein
MNGDFRLAGWLVQPGLNSISQNGTSRRLEPKVMEFLSARHKMPLEVTPFFPWLTRSGAVVNPTATANAANPTPSN